MSPSTAENLLWIWETGRDQHPVDRALTMLLGAGMGETRQQLAALPVAQRDERLLQLREQVFGTRIEAFVQCPRCSENLEFTLSTAQIRAHGKGEEIPDRCEGEAPSLAVVSDDIKVCFRLPDSLDLAAAAQCDKLSDARHLIVRRCIREVCRGHRSLDIQSLPVHALDAAGAEIERRQQQAEVLLEFQCPACGLSRQMMFDIVSFLWAEIETEAASLLREVHILASAYGWRETDILSLSPVRRRFYLEAVL